MKKIVVFILINLFGNLSAGERIISMGPALTEMVFALGKGGSLVGVSPYCIFPPEAKKLPKVGTPFTPLMEKIILLKPDLVFTQDLNDSTFENKLKKLKISQLKLKLNTYSDIKKSFSTLANKLKVSDEAIQKNFLEKEKKLQDLKIEKSALVIVGWKWKLDALVGVIVAGRGTYHKDLLEMMKMTVLTNGENKPFFHLNWEELIRLHPDYLVSFSAKPNTEKGKIKAMLSRFHLKKTKVIYLENDYGEIPGPRIPLLMEDIYREFAP